MGGWNVGNRYLRGGNMGSITRWIDDLARGDQREVAARALADRYFDNVVRYASRDLLRRGALCSVNDGEDAANEAFAKVFRGIESGQLKLESRDDFLGVLKWSTKCVLINGLDGNPVVHAGERSPWDGDVRDVHKKYSPDALVGVDDACRGLLGLLDEGLQQVALLKLVGLTNGEVATKIGRTVTTVERKLDLIRTRWDSFDPGSPGVGRPRGQGGPPAGGDIGGATTILNGYMGLS